ncbi:MAG TPA: aromatic ring-hydroxylating dioxygenase subunit alpha [Bryobacteraceae bacterium]|nr:aromatic ring-hydroxylating dioxygenase subunit alpha [Bryobacteraceae bacterium]
MPSKTLPARYYTDPGWFQDEVERFFARRWFCAGRADVIPHAGDYFLRDLAGESLIVVRDSDSTIRAFYNVCRHRGTRLCSAAEGTFSARILCPYHGWAYALDGRLVGAPHMDGVGFRREDYPLQPLHAALWDGHIFLHMGRRPQPLSRQLAGLPGRFAAWRMEELRLGRRILYDVKANWKLVILNYNECLHCPLVHPGLNRLTDYLGADNEPPRDTYIGGAMGFSGSAQTMNADGRLRRPYLPGLNEFQRKHVYYYAIFPNLLLALHPDYMLIHTLWPKAVDRTEIICEWYFHESTVASPGFDPTDAVEFWDCTNREDWRIVEQSQLGIQSRAYTPGPYSRREELLAGFDKLVRSSARPRRTRTARRR